MAIKGRNRSSTNAWKSRVACQEVEKNKEEEEEKEEKRNIVCFFGRGGWGSSRIWHPPAHWQLRVSVKREIIGRGFFLGWAPLIGRNCSCRLTWYLNVGFEPLPKKNHFFFNQSSTLTIPYYKFPFIGPILERRSKWFPTSFRQEVRRQHVTSDVIASSP